MGVIYDIIILGAGPAGLAAGLYAGRACRKALILERGQDGGQIANTLEIDNYPGQMLEGESGATLAARMAAQAERFGVRRALDEVQSVALEGPVKKLTGYGGEYLGRAVILATGATPRPIGCENEEQFVGRGISYCATCDAAFFKGLPVYVVGGGDAAVEEAMYLTKFARSVTVIHRRERLRAAKSIQERAFRTPGLSFLWNTVVESVHGETALNKLVVRDVQTGQRTTVEPGGRLGLFGFTGHLPNTALFQGLLDMENGYLKTDENLQTNIPGVYAAGDVRVKKLRQVVTAVADGAIAAVQAEQYLESAEG